MQTYFAKRFKLLYNRKRIMQTNDYSGKEETV